VFAYIVRRIAVTVPVLIVFSFVMYLILYQAADPKARIRQIPGIRGEDIERLTKQMGLDKPWYTGYWDWLKNVLLHGDFGTSFSNKAANASTLLFDRMPATLELLLGALIVATLIGAPLGIFSALRPYSGFDYVATSFAYIGFALPTFLLGLLLQLFALWMQSNGWAIIPLVLGIILVLSSIFRLAKGGMWPRILVAVGVLLTVIALVFWGSFGGHGHLVLPTAGRFTGATGTMWSVDHVKHLVLPVITLAVVSIAGWSRYQRSTTLDVLSADYLRTARAKGLSERTVIGRHALRNALIPLISVLAVDIGGVFVGAVITETVFGWPGVGRLFFESAQNRDIPVAMAVLIFGAILIVVFNLLADIAYAITDPRIRLS
jgi:peptide/nickel transport system permease protein